MKQHFLPQAYLREFCNPDGKLFALDIDLLKFKRKVFPELKNTAEVCRSKDFYTIQGDFGNEFPHLKGLDPLFLEKKFQEYEHEYPKLIAKIKKHQSDLSIKEAEILMYSIIDMKIRNPYFRQTSVAAKKETVIDTLFNSYREELEVLELTEDKQLKRKDVILQEMDKMKAKIMADEDFSRKTHLSSLVLRQMEDENIQQKITKHLLQFEWRVFESHNAFFTTDNPGVSLDPTNRPQNTKFNDDFMFFVPITPHMCLGITSKIPDKKHCDEGTSKQIYYADAPKAMVHKINELQSCFVTKFIFSNNKRLIDILANKINRQAGL